MLCLFIISLVITAKLVYEDKKEEKRVESKFKEIKQSFIRSSTGDSGEVYIDEDIAYLETLKAQNSDVVGYLNIPDTDIAYPVMQSVYEPDFYLSHDINKQYSFYGTPYLSAYCKLNKADNLIIYGHNINYGKMFGALLQYKDKKFYKTHSEIRFTTNKTDRYKIFAVFSVDINEFNYWKFVMAKDESHYKDFIKKAKGYSGYDTGVTPSYNDELITLSTCDNSRGDNYRFVVMSMKIE